MSVTATAPQDAFRPLRFLFKDVIPPDRPRKFLTLIYVFDDSLRTVLLGMKTRGFGAGKWNAFGGKFDPATDASIADSAVRELEEESGLYAPRECLRLDAVLYFMYPDALDARTFEVHVFSCRRASLPPLRRSDGRPNEPVGSEEMSPVEWFPADRVPLHQMWADDPFWLPQYLAWNIGPAADSTSPPSDARGLRFAGAFDFADFATVRVARIVTGDELHRASADRAGAT